MSLCKLIIPKVVLCITCVATDRCRLQDDADLHRRFIVEAPSAWSVVKSSYDNLEASGLETTRYREKDEVRIERTSERKVLALRGLYWVLKERHRNSDGPSAEIVLGVNSNYAFLLARPRDSSEYRITRFGVPTSKFRDVFEERAMRFLSAPWTLIERPLQSFVADEAFTLKWVNWSDDDFEGSPLVRVAFDYRPGDESRSPLRSGWFDLAPERLWTMQRSFCEVVWGTIRSEITYEGGADGVPVVRSIVRKYSSADEERESETIFEFTALRFGEPDEMQFTLGSFGLPELAVADKAKVRP